MFVVQWLKAAAMRRGRPAGKIGWDVPHSDPGRRIICERLDAKDSYWWILAGGIHVPGFGPNAGAPEDS